MRLSNSAAALIIYACLAPAAIAESQPRRVLPGDHLQFTFSQNPSLSREAVVAEDGRVDVPGWGRVALATLTLAELPSQLKRDFPFWFGREIPAARFYAVNGAPVAVGGCVRRTLSVRVGHNFRLLSLLALAEPTPEADLNHLQIDHPDGSSDILAANQDPVLRDGDRIDVPRARQLDSVMVVGGVNHPAQLSLSANLDVASAIALAGGFSTRADDTRIVVVRGGESIPVDPADASNTRLKSGDVLTVAVTRSMAHILVEGRVRKPGLVDFKPGMTLRSAIAAAGGLIEGLRPTVVGFTHAVDGYSRAVKLNLADLSSGRRPDPLLVQGDRIEVGVGESREQDHRRP